ncbi:helix-turn-helix transcriptional regulator [Desulfopila sp. IMCC35006]|uniref:helix-turn-helix domain-containing protein n=1 Tax=Desulfopila sp. IMCC35006 TaxID=2569542 RepID=UPI0010ACC170|nr:helix-turn-helix transcriptional regulator [Desulfopila sp. IMCC35006]TKB24616.1 helix-turn-helix transcriptional regulator [Desulfopila sp. IMCC35006]
MRSHYKDEVLKKVQQAWLQYKAQARINQTQAAKALGIKQSAFSQYLRGPEKGGIQLNTDFLTKFADFIHMDLAEFGLDSGIELKRPAAFSLELRYTLSGATLTGRCFPVQSIVPKRNCYAVLVDMQGFVMPKGSIIIIDPDADISEHDGVICKTGDGPVKVGQIVDAEDGWRIISPVWGKVLSFKADEEGIVHRIIGYYHPDGKGKIYQQKK